MIDSLMKSVPLAQKLGFYLVCMGRLYLTEVLRRLFQSRLLLLRGKAMIVESMDQDTEKRFMHHYNDSPFAYNEVGVLGANRRAIGHGALAERALEAVLPAQEDFLILFE
jgi:hypothetical protein